MFDSLFLQGVMSYTNLVLALFVLVFAIFFLRETAHTKHRQPWVFLLFAIIVFFSLQVVNVLGILGFVNISSFRFIFDLLFLTIILFTFIFQYSLILHSEKLMIQRHEKITKKQTKTPKKH